MGQESASLAYDQVRTIEDLTRLAHSIASKPFVPSPPLPRQWAETTYDEYRKVVFQPDKAFWRADGCAYFLEAFHRGFVHHDNVSIYSIEKDRVREIPFDSSLFDYRGTLSGDALGADFGFAGFRVVGKYPQRADWQEMITFLGASYFRARTAEGVYGSSARGLAIDVGLSKPEEFPVFRVFWVEKPTDREKSGYRLALMDSPSVSGAYRFKIEPGTRQTVLDVQAVLFFRQSVERVGLAPLTSMWMWGDGLPGPSEDERPEVHDSDSLLICSETRMEMRNGFVERSCDRTTPLSFSSRASG